MTPREKLDEIEDWLKRYHGSYVLNHPRAKIEYDQKLAQRDFIRQIWGYELGKDIERRPMGQPVSNYHPEFEGEIKGFGHPLYNNNITEKQPMNIVFESQQVKTTFRMVEDSQLFINNLGYLCQKCCDESYVSIADCTGKPHGSVYDDVDEDQEITKILPKVKKFEFN